MQHKTTGVFPLRKSGRPKSAVVTGVMALRISEDLLQQVDSWAVARGLNRNQAGAELLRLALAPPAGGYNPKTGSFQ